MNYKRILGTLLLFAVLWVSGGCQSATPNLPASATYTITSTAEILTPTETTLPPTATVPPAPLAAQVNGEGVRLDDYEDEYTRYQDASSLEGSQVDEKTAKATVLESMIDTLLFAQAARENGYQLDDETFNQRFTQLVTDSGGQETFDSWLTKNHYNDQSFCARLPPRSGSNLDA